MPIHKKQLYLMLGALLLVLAFAACSASATPAPTVQPTVPPAPTNAPTTVPPTLAPTQVSTNITVTDSAGRKLTLNAPPARIVSLAPSTTEIVCAVGGCDKLVGVDSFSDFPAQVKQVAKVSDGFNPNYEQIVAAQPDLVLVAGITAPDVIKKLDELKLPFLIVGAETTTFESIQNEIKMVAAALGDAAQADTVIAAMDKKIADVTAKIADAKTKPRVFWEVDATDPAKPYTVGPGSFVAEIIARAGGENIAQGASSPYPQFSAEQIIQANPQVIILSDAAYGVAPESVGKRPGWDVIDAVKLNQVFPIDDNLVSRPGPRVAEGLAAAAKLIHPELFAP